MTKGYRHVNDYLEGLLSGRTREELRERLSPSHGPAAPKIPSGSTIDAESVDGRWAVLNAPAEVRGAIADPVTVKFMERFQRNIENFIGTAKVPLGVIGPLRVNGLFAKGDYYVPLATTEAALVASYNRGAGLITAVGGCTAMILSEGVSRAPGFAFRTAADAGEFVIWALSSVDTFRELAESTTSYGKFVDVRVTFEGNHVYLNIEMTTGDASGQNMVTFAANAICEYIQQNSPVRPEYSFVEANLSGDKKASFQSFSTVRGKKVTAEVVIPDELVQSVLHTTPERMVDLWRMSALGGVLSGCIGVQGHYANGLAALFIATGQDAASVAEAAVGVTRLERIESGDLYATVTLPNLIVGTVGGGTSLPTQRACLEIMGLAGPGNARAFAEVCAALSLAGELSIIGALCAGQFAGAHERLARGKTQHGHKTDADG